MNPVTTPKSKMAPQLARLFHTAGLLSESEWSSFIKKNQKHKPILGVLMQQVSLETFRDLLNADITSFKTGSSPHEALHTGLTSSRMINDQELAQLLSLHRPPLAQLIAPLERDGVLDGDRAGAILAENGRRGSSDPGWLISDGILSAQAIGEWLSNPEGIPAREAAMWVAVVLAEANGLVPEDLLREAPGILEQSSKDLARKLSQFDGFRASSLMDLIEEGIRLPFEPPAEFQPDPMLFGLFPQSFLRRQMMVPLFREENRLGIATSDPLNLPLWALIRWATGLWPQPFLSQGQDIINLINSFYSKAEAPSREARSVTPPPAPIKQAKPQAQTGDGRKAEPAPAPAWTETRGEVAVADNVSAVQLVSSLIESALDTRATDIHLEPMADGMTVRFRIDGELRRILTIPQGLMQPVTSRIKVLAEMDVTERRRPQDGHFELRLEDRGIDFRISTLPAIHGEKVVIRILDSARVSMGLADLGMLPDQQKLFEQMLEMPFGMILVTGPTGSGKTSTLYTALSRLNVESHNLVTIEDPVEYQLVGVNQVQVDSNISMGFAQGLRSILRQDPDVIMVGEIRDGDTAHIAIRAAMTGHLVLSTLHTNTALGAIDALVHLGAMRFMVAASLIGILSQRLVRKLCGDCRKGQMLKADVAARLGLPEGTRKRIYQAHGCNNCLGSGYLGRTGVFETVAIHEAMRPMVADPHGMAALEQAAREAKMLSLSQAAALKVLDGQTTVDEVSRKILFEI
ncbi:GspE/PulE family protein [bacterium]|nr:GspE/PulE family protein [bacterium]